MLSKKFLLPLMKNVFLLFLIFSCTPRHILLPPPAQVSMVRADYSNLDLYVTVFDVKNLTSKDNYHDIAYLRNKFIEYLEARNQFHHIFYFGEKPEEDQNTDFITVELTVTPDHTAHRTWILDLPFFYPFSGYWPLTPKWGNVKVSMYVQIFDSQNILIEELKIQKEKSYFIVFYSWYRTEPIERALKFCYEEAFTELSNKLRENRDRIFAAIEHYASERRATEVNTAINKPYTKMSIGVIDLDVVGISKDYSSTLTNRLLTELFKTGKFNVLERKKIQEILKEQGFQLTGCTSSECLIQAGRLLNVQRIVGGSVSKISNYFSIELRLIDVESGEIISVANEDVQGDIGQVLMNGLKRATMKLVR